LTGYRATNTGSLLPPVAGLKLLFLVRVPAARSSLGLRDVPDVGDRRAARARRWRHAPTPTSPQLAPSPFGRNLIRRFERTPTCIPRVTDWHPRATARAFP